MLNSGVSRPTSSGLRAKASGQRRCRDPVGCGKVTTVEQHRATTVTVTIVTIESVENLVTIVTIVYYSNYSRDRNHFSISWISCSWVFQSLRDFAFFRLSQAKDYKGGKLLGTAIHSAMPLFKTGEFQDHDSIYESMGWVVTTMIFNGLEPHSIFFSKPN